MQIISFKQTAMLKRGVWLTALALIANVAAPAVLNGELWRQPAVSVVPLCILIGFWIYFLRKTPFYRVVDEVVDCGDLLQIRSGRKEEVIPLADVSTVEVATSLRIHHISLRLRTPTTLGNQVEFFPQASLWGNLPAVQQLASSLATRANQSRSAGAAGGRSSSLV